MSTDLEKPQLSEFFRPFIVVAVTLGVMWAVEIIDLFPGTSFDSWGIRPRSVRGLVGIPLAPFLHGGFGHLIANSFPFAILGGAIAIGGVDRFVEVTVSVAVFAGIGTWAFGGANSVHIGASGIVFGYVTYLISRGVFARHLLWLVGGVIVLAMYGGILWGLLPRTGISFTGHLFGALGGIATAYLMHGDHDTDELSPTV